MLTPTLLYLPSPVISNILPTVSFYTFVKNALPLDVAIPVEELHNSLKQEYPYYMKSLEKKGETLRVLPIDKFNDRVDNIFNRVKEGDLVSEPDLGNPFYVFDLDGDLYAKPLIGDYSRTLPIEAVRMLKQYNVKYLEDLPWIYRDVSVRSIEHAPGKTLPFLQRYGDFRATRIEVTLDGYTFFTDGDVLNQGDKEQLKVREIPPVMTTGPGRGASPTRQVVGVRARVTPQVPATPPITETNYWAMKITYLKDLLRQRGLKVTGPKGDLVARLEAADGR